MSLYDFIVVRAVTSLASFNGAVETAVMPISVDKCDNFTVKFYVIITREQSAMIDLFSFLGTFERALMDENQDGPLCDLLFFFLSNLFRTLNEEEGESPYVVETSDLGI